MSHVKRFVAWCMKIWIEDRSERRKEADKERERTVLDALPHGSAESRLSAMPQRQRISMPIRIRRWLEERAKSGYSDIPLCAANVRKCGIVITPEEERTLIGVALEKTNGIEAKLTLLRALHGERIPLPILLNLAKQSRESTGGWMSGPDADYIKYIVKELDTKNPQAVDALATMLAEEGRQLSLTTMYRLFGKHVPVGYYQRCFQTLLGVKNPTEPKYHYATVARMCINLADWETGTTLISTWDGIDDATPFAGQIALAMHKAHAYSSPI